ncbi:TlpA family protein disulfide reductase [Caproicibacter sp.]|uniref:TlpA family protein disulfide reductase n=1 Tax=Caproicibacter sp. TaxID=2814884 RepID=UPI003989CEF6
MNRAWKTVLLTAAFAAVLGGAYFAYTGLSARYRPESDFLVSSAPTSSQSAAGSSQAASSAVEAPDFTVYDADGNAVHLSDFKGKPVVLNFWASWCYYCKQEMPEFNQVYGEEKDRVQFLFVNWTDGRQETQEKGEAFLKQSGYNFPAYYDLNQEAVSAYGLTGIPATFFIRADGTVAAGSPGAMDGDTLKKGIELILSGS